MDAGEEEITGFGQDHVKEVSKIMKKQDRRKKNKKLIPLYVFIILIVLVTGGSILKEQLAREDQQQLSQAEQNQAQERIDFAEELMEVGENILGEGLVIFILVVICVILPLVLIFVILWYLFMRHVDKQHHKWVCNALGPYLSSELQEFWQEDPVSGKLDAKYTFLKEHMQEQYEKIISDVLGNLLGEPEQDSNQKHFVELCNRWHQIRKEG